eukprot:2694487-Rhodomonas_salina.2
MEAELTDPGAKTKMRALSWMSLCKHTARDQDERSDTFAQSNFAKKKVVALPRIAGNRRECASRSPSDRARRSGYTWSDDTRVGTCHD